ncbi:30S ribosomal protein S19e [Halolamina litorea]|uniref:Small ribosomal subunit protein eS19 n=1 Tax=Halolamina litorea TaxID=1515593 RepID=A0ABD6BMK7_9EURY|nr:30S ribosomal protein S19e [Halolamina litorea]
MATLYDVPAEDLIEALAEELDGRIEEPDWVEFTKTSVDRELPPQQDDFWFVRAASLLRKVAVRGPVGVERLATEYGGSKQGTTRYRVAGSEHTGGSRKIIRVALQQLEEEGLLETAKGEGRRVTDEGQSLLDTVAGETLEDLDRPELQKYA